MEGVSLTGSTSFMDYEIRKDTLIEIGGTNVTSDGKWTIREHFVLDENGHSGISGIDSVLDTDFSILFRE